MARLWAAATGNIVRVDASRDEEVREAPEGAVESLFVDETTNAALLLDMARGAASYRLKSGVLTRNGGTVVLAASSVERAQERQLISGIIASFSAGTPLTDRQRDGAIALLLRKIFGKP